VRGLAFWGPRELGFHEAVLLPIRCHPLTGPSLDPAGPCPASILWKLGGLSGCILANLGVSFWDFCRRPAAFTERGLCDGLRQEGGLVSLVLEATWGSPCCPAATARGPYLPGTLLWNMGTTHSGTGSCLQL
jgi:hypothetical protein